VAQLQISARVRNVGGPPSTVWGPLANPQKKIEKWKCIRMWISILKFEITGKQSKKLPKKAKQQPTEN